ncbi:MAG: hypothetical protein IT539_13805 [Bradyrhizobiaceae bacterium]|nr:hypothetical protein [Bradyrhizobiaceae bacterium]
MAKRDKKENLYPSHPVALDTLANVRTEMARLYRLGLKRDISPDAMTKFVYVLREIRGCIEAKLLEDVQGKLAELSAKVEARHGR